MRGWVKGGRGGLKNRYFSQLRVHKNMVQHPINNVSIHTVICKKYWVMKLKKNTQQIQLMLAT